MKSRILTKEPKQRPVKFPALFVHREKGIVWYKEKPGATELVCLSPGTAPALKIGEVLTDPNYRGEWIENNDAFKYVTEPISIEYAP